MIPPSMKRTSVLDFEIMPSMVRADFGLIAFRSRK